jgi:diadenosine tetraphosphatase ApaH/serine/threonine PP2A family protein phosphatase
MHGGGYCSLSPIPPVLNVTCCQSCVTELMHLCCHSSVERRPAWQSAFAPCAGIGRSINSVDQIDALVRPLTMEHGGIVLMDLLWSDPTTNDGVEGVQPSPRGPGLVTFGPDRVKEFCKVWPLRFSAHRLAAASTAVTWQLHLCCLPAVRLASDAEVLTSSRADTTCSRLAQNNELQMIVRAHECVMDGFERFAQGHLITLFSATNYCGTANNAGAILVCDTLMALSISSAHGSPNPCCDLTPATSVLAVRAVAYQHAGRGQAPGFCRFNAMDQSAHIFMGL